MTSERDLFETWASSQNWIIDRDSFGDYRHSTARDGWEAWQAARRAQASAEPFGYFRAFACGWTDCAATDEGAKALYEAAPQQSPLTDEQIDAATSQARDALLDHIYEYSTLSEGIMRLVRKLARTVEAAHGISAAKEAGND